MGDQVAATSGLGIMFDSDSDSESQSRRFRMHQPHLGKGIDSLCAAKSRLWKAVL